MRKFLPPILAILLAFFMVAAPALYYRSYSIEYRNLRVVEPGVLYRSGQMTVPRLEQVVHTLGIRTIVCLRGEKDATDKNEESWAKANKVEFVRIPPLSWSPDSTGVIPADANAAIFRKVMADPAKHPVLVHCFAGVHRTGIMCAIFRMDLQGWTSTEAVNEMRANGYTILDDHEDIQAYFAQRRSQPIDRLHIAQPVSRSKNVNP